MEVVSRENEQHILLIDINQFLLEVRSETSTFVSQFIEETT